MENEIYRSCGSKISRSKKVKKTVCLDFNFRAAKHHRGEVYYLVGKVSRWFLSIPRSLFGAQNIYYSKCIYWITIGRKKGFAKYKL